MAEKTGADWVLYQELEDLEAAVREVNPDIAQFDSSCFRSALSLAVYLLGDQAAFEQTWEIIMQWMAKLCSIDLMPLIILAISLPMVNTRAFQRQVLDGRHKRRVSESSARYEE